MRRLRIDADLRFAVSGTAADGWAGSVSGTITARGTHLEVRTDDLDRLAGGGSDRALRALAAGLARQGLTLALTGPRGTVLVVGAVRGRLLDRVATGSRHVRVVGWREAWRLRRAQRAGSGASDLLPPPTPLPVAPTFRRIRRAVTTTHDPLGGGRPQLVLAAGPNAQRSADRKVFRLAPGTTTIGSDTECDLVLAGLAPRHAEIRRDEDDEYVLSALADDQTSVDGAPVRVSLLRSCSRVQLGGWRFSYWREELADHGRPYGGRSGGEGSHQQDQPRPRYDLPRPPAGPR